VRRAVVYVDLDKSSSFESIRYLLKHNIAVTVQPVVATDSSSSDDFMEFNTALSNQLEDQSHLVTTVFGPQLLEDEPVTPFNILLQLPVSTKMLKPSDVFDIHVVDSSELLASDTEHAKDFSAQSIAGFDVHSKLDQLSSFLDSRDSSALAAVVTGKVTVDKLEALLALIDTRSSSGRKTRLVETIICDGDFGAALLKPKQRGTAASTSSGTGEISSDESSEAAPSSTDAERQRLLEQVVDRTPKLLFGVHPNELFEATATVENSFTALSSIGTDSDVSIVDRLKPDHLTINPKLLQAAVRIGSQGVSVDAYPVIASIVNK
jgi:hypothetical protein